ncbi:uncharacterized protein [Eleutherodactylus coqui]|uniref:uncharacterized protein n=1 Tax=Eleutherodactylus coqui TaxID=57060 RepID=UPI0034633FEB
MEDLQQLKDKILNYQLAGTKLGELGYTRILIQICGLAGNGKSSLINSFKHALYNKKFSMPASVAPPEHSQGGFTTVRNSYKLTDVITLVDNRGFGKSDSFEKEELYAQLANIQPLDKKVVWDRSYEERMKAVTSTSHNTNDLLVPIYVHSVENQIIEDDKGDMKTLLTTIHEITGFLPVIVLTKKLSGDADEMRLQFDKASAENIFAVENYTEKNNMKSPGKDRSFLTILSAVLDLVDFAANSVVPTLDTPEQEHLKRVQMLLTMACNNEVLRKKDKWMKENMPAKTQPTKEKKNLVSKIRAALKTHRLDN